MADPRIVEQGGVFVASTAVVLGDVTLGAGANVWFGSVLRGDVARIRVGERTNLQDLVMVHCDTAKDQAIGADVTVGHHAILHGRRIGDGCLIGMGAILLGGSEIGDGCLVGAGALVREGQILPPRSIAVGVPAKVVGSVTDAQAADFLDRARKYLELARRHARGDFAAARP
jgi:carbonic anhydrase/acetyltransferase-like protein (isoleucine patch superfamily)